MRHTIIATTTTALITAMVASWGTTVIIAHSPKTTGAATATASNSIDVMQMMRDAKNLQEEKYDAY
jgi:hypothetical protein